MWIWGLQFAVSMFSYKPNVQDKMTIKETKELYIII